MTITGRCIFSGNSYCVVLTVILIKTRGICAVLSVIVTTMTVTGRSMCSANSYCDNNGRSICSVNSYCDINEEVYMQC